MDSKRMSVIGAVIDQAITAGEAAEELEVPRERVQEWVDIIALSRKPHKSVLAGIDRRWARIAIISSAVIGLLGGVFLSASEVWAQTQCQPGGRLRGLYVFCPGQAASAAEVNENFSILSQLVQTRTGTIDTNSLTSRAPYVFFQDMDGNHVEVNSVGTGTAGVSGAINFGNATRQMLNLYDSRYGIGVQASTQYYRTATYFAWYMGGVHSDGALDPGGGVRQMAIDTHGNVSIRGGVFAASLNAPLGRSACDWSSSLAAHTCASGRYVAGVRNCNAISCEYLCCAP